MENKKSDRYARQLRVTIGDMYHWKNRPKIKVAFDFSPMRSLSLEVQDIRNSGRAFDYRKFGDKLEESGWEILRMIPTFRDEEIPEFKTPIMQFWVRKIEDADIDGLKEAGDIRQRESIQKNPDIGFTEHKLHNLISNAGRVEVCSCQEVGEHCCYKHSTEPEAFIF